MPGMSRNGSGIMEMYCWSQNVNDCYDKGYLITGIRLDGKYCSITTKLESSINAVSLANLSPGFYTYKFRSEATLKNGKLVKL